MERYGLPKQCVRLILQYHERTFSNPILYGVNHGDSQMFFLLWQTYIKNKVINSRNGLDFKSYYNKVLPNRRRRHMQYFHILESIEWGFSKRLTRRFVNIKIGFIPEDRISLIWILLVSLLSKQTYMTFNIFNVNLCSLYLQLQWTIQENEMECKGKKYRQRKCLY